MSTPRLYYKRNINQAGEYIFTPEALTLSVGFSRTKVEIAYDGSIWNGTGNPGDIKVIPTGQEWIFRHTRACHFARITIDERAVFGGALAGALIQPHASLRDAPLRHILSALWADATQTPITALFQNALAEAAAARLAELNRVRIDLPRHRLSRSTLRRVTEYLEVHLANDVTVEELAAIVGLSPAHFSTLFRNSTGEPPHRYHIRLRVERARALLESGIAPSAAAIAVGFYDQSHLARHMRRLLGASPALFWRRRPQ